MHHPMEQLPGPLLAFDVGGTDLKAVLAAADGSELAAATVPTPLGGRDPGADVLAAAAGLIPQLLRGVPETPVAVGVVVPGIVDEVAGTGVYSANLGWRNYPFRERAARLFGLPVGFGHDVGMAGEAEMAAGSGHGSGDVAVVVIGTGIAATLFDEGRRIRGAGFAGELGHLIVPGGGGPVHLESVASAAAIARAYSHRSGRPVAGAREVFAAAAAGDDQATASLETAFDALAHGFLQLSTLLGTERFVLTGGLARAGEALRKPVAERLAQAVDFQRPPIVGLGTLGARAGIAGALVCARRAAEGTR